MCMDKIKVEEKIIVRMFRLADNDFMVACISDGRDGFASLVLLLCDTQHFVKPVHYRLTL